MNYEILIIFFILFPLACFFLWKEWSILSKNYEDLKDDE